MVAKTIGTKVSFAWETTPGVRPTTGYQTWCDCTSHPDFNPEPDQIETTTLCETFMHTYEDGLVDFGTLEFGANMTVNTYDLISGANGFVTVADTKAASNLRLWVCVDIANFPKSFYVPVKPTKFGLPEGEAGSNKYDLVVRFIPAESAVAGSDGAGWYDDPTYAGETNYTATVTGYVADGVTLKVFNANNIMVREVVTTGTSTAIVLPAGTYTIIASKAEKTTQVKDADLTSANATVTFSTFA